MQNIEDGAAAAAAAAGATVEGRKEEVPGMHAFLAARSKTAGAGVVGKQGLAATGRKHKEEIVVQVRAWLSLDPLKVADAWKWWATRGRTSYPYLLPPDGFFCSGLGTQVWNGIFQP